MSRVCREGFLEIDVGVEGEPEWMPVWASLEGIAPEGLRVAWEDGALCLFSDSKRTRSCGTFSFKSCKLSPLADPCFSLELPSKVSISIRSPLSGKSYKKWVSKFREVCGDAFSTVSEITDESSSVPATGAAPSAAPSSSTTNNNASTLEETCAQLEGQIQLSLESCLFMQSIEDLVSLRKRLLHQRMSSLEGRVEELRVSLIRCKRELAPATPPASSRPPKITVSNLANANAPPNGNASQHQSGCSIIELVQSLRDKGCSASLVAKHIYSAMGHRPHEEEPDAASMTPATVALVEAVQKVSASQQMAQLKTVIAKDDAFVLEMVREYSKLFLRLRGLDLLMGVRRMMFHFKPPKESQQIARVIRAFAETYFSMHEGLAEYDMASSAFAPESPDASHHYGPGEHINWPDVESVEVIVFALIMLNGDLHNPENTEKMTKQQFIDNIKRSGAKVSLTDASLAFSYSSIKDDPIPMDNALVPFPDAVRKGYLDVKVKGALGLRFWTRAWVVLCENYDLTCAATQEERSRRSGGMGILYLCKSSRDESSVYLTFPLRRTVSLVEDGKREFSLIQATGAGTSTNSLRSLLAGGGPGAVKQEELRIKVRCKSDSEYANWIRSLHFVLKGGYGFWYARDVKEDDYNLDLPEDDVTPKAQFGKKTKRRRAKGTLKKKKATGAAASNASSERATPVNSPRQLIEVAGAENSVESEDVTK